MDGGTWNGAPRFLPAWQASGKTSLAQRSHGWLRFEDRGSSNAQTGQAHASERAGRRSLVILVWTKMQTLGKMHRAFADRSVRVPCRRKRAVPRTTRCPITQASSERFLSNYVVSLSDRRTRQSGTRLHKTRWTVAAGMARKRHIKSWRCGRATRFCCDKAKKGCLFACP